MKYQNFLKLSFRLFAMLAFVAFATQSLAQPSSFDRIVAFGASLTDTGNSFVWLSNQENQSCGISQNVPPYDKLDD